MSTNRSLIEDEIKEELIESLQPHGLEVDNVYLSSLTPIEGNVVEETVKEAKKPENNPKSPDEIVNSRFISGNIPKSDQRG